MTIAYYFESEGNYKLFVNNEYVETVPIKKGIIKIPLIVARFSPPYEIWETRSNIHDGRIPKLEKRAILLNKIFNNLNIKR